MNITTIRNLLPCAPGRQVLIRTVVWHHIGTPCHTSDDGFVIIRDASWIRWSREEHTAVISGGHIANDQITPLNADQAPCPACPGRTAVSEDQLHEMDLCEAELEEALADFEAWGPLKAGWLVVNAQSVCDIAVMPPTAAVKAAK